MNNTGFSVPEIEQAIVSSMMQWSERLNEGVALLRPEYFRSGPNQILFKELVKQYALGIQFELIAFTQSLRDSSQLDAVGGPFYVTQTCCNTCHSDKVFAYYIDRLLEEYERLKLVGVCTESIALAENGNPEVVSETIAAVSEIPVRRAREHSFAEAVDEKFERMQSGAPNDDIVLTGLSELDRQSPLHKGDMPLIVGERKAGKSILALSILLNVASRGVPAAYFSLEDRKPKVLDRIVSGISKIPTSLDHVEKLSAFQQTKMAVALEKARSFPITIIDDTYNLIAIIARARSLVARGCALLILDYAQLIQVSGLDSRREEVEKVSRDLRLLAMETATPLILLCQINKEGETRESKALEMDCTACWKLDFPSGKNDKPDMESNERFIRIPFQRNGESGISIKVTFLGNIARVENYSNEPARA